MSNSNSQIIYGHIEQKIASSILNKPKDKNLYEVVLENKEFFKHFNNTAIEQIQVKYMKQATSVYNKLATSGKPKAKPQAPRVQYSYGTIYEHIEKKIAQVFRESNDYPKTTEELEQQYKHFNQAKIGQIIVKYLKFHCTAEGVLE